MGVEKSILQVTRIIVSHPLVLVSDTFFSCIKSGWSSKCKLFYDIVTTPMYTTCMQRSPCTKSPTRISIVLKTILRKVREWVRTCQPCKKPSEGISSRPWRMYDTTLYLWISISMQRYKEGSRIVPGAPCVYISWSINQSIVSLHSQLDSIKPSSGNKESVCMKHTLHKKVI